MKTKKALNNKVFSEYYIAPHIKNILDKAKRQVTTGDWDRVYIIDGEEGSGKSLLGLQLGYYLDPTLNLDRITFNGKDFSNAIDKAEKHQCIIFDEAFNGLASSGAMSKMNRLIVSKLMECRQRNLFIIIILPTIFLLQKYVSIFRSKGLFHVYSTKKGQRGYYRTYNKKNKKYLYLSGMKFYSYKYPYIKKKYRFYGKYPIDEMTYRAKKDQAMKDEKDSNNQDKYYFKFLLLAKRLKETHKDPFSTIATYLKDNKHPIDSTNISRGVAKLSENP